ncbi:hypothetical protein ACN38_g5163 [Penicillium nordicum]|uniref:Uncharacterized protein n=1 Tax=Penicillium nordicum TaxID=229535 RepID=A0A0M8P259_9EURO|nr:hypothetical protein ACN38_g5163 [Penicillium nordicum]
MLEDIQSDDPFVRSRAVQSLDSLSPLIQDLAQSKKTVHYTAGKFKSLQDACAILEVTHKTHEHIWDRQDIDDVHSVTLSPDVDSVIQRLHHSEYHKIDNWESSVRVVVELIILDRLHNLSDRGALEHLQLYPEVDVDLLVVWLMDSERRLFSSPIFEWRVQKAKIITWIDKMLAEAIEASRNVSPRNWEKDFRQRQLLSSEPDGSPSTEGLPFDIIAPDSSHIVGTAWYRTKRAERIAQLLLNVARNHAAFLLQVSHYELSNLTVAFCQKKKKEKGEGISPPCWVPEAQDHVDSFPLSPSLLSLLVQPNYYESICLLTLLQQSTSHCTIHFDVHNVDLF